MKKKWNVYVFYEKITEGEKKICATGLLHEGYEINNKRVKVGF